VRAASTFRAIALMMIILMMEAVQTSETLVSSYHSTRRYNPEGSHLQLFIVDN
jgi:hypothetical protein